MVARQQRRAAWQGALEIKASALKAPLKSIQRVATFLNDLCLNSQKDPTQVKFGGHAATDYLLSGRNAQSTVFPVADSGVPDE